MLSENCWSEAVKPKKAQGLIKLCLCIFTTKTNTLCSWVMCSSFIYKILVKVISFSHVHGAVWLYPPPVAPHDEEITRRSGVTYWFYDALCTGEHGAHNGKVLGVRHPPLAHVFEDFSCCWGSQGVFGVEANIGIDASRENTKSSSENKPCGEKKHQHECLNNKAEKYLQTWGMKDACCSLI